MFLLVTYLTPPVNDETLRDFYNKVKPGQWGWRRVAEKYGIAPAHYLGRAFVNFLLGTALLFLINFGVGTLLLRSLWLGLVEILLGVVLAFILIRRIKKDDSFPEGERDPLADEVEKRELASRV